MFTEFTLFNHLLLLLFICLLIRGWHIVTRPGMLFAFVGKRLLYIEEEELLKTLPQEVREQKLLALLAFEGSLQQIGSTSSPTTPKSSPTTDEPETAANRAALFEEFTDYLKEIKAYTDLNYEHLAATYEAKRHRQRWKRLLGKPLGNCITCASSVFGICGMAIAYLPMLLAGSVSPVLWLVFLVSLPVVAGLNSVAEK